MLGSGLVKVVIGRSILWNVWLEMFKVWIGRILWNAWLIGRILWNAWLGTG